MFATYRPFLKAKPGEFEAITNLSDQMHRFVDPTYVVGTPRQNRERGRQGKQRAPSIATYLTQVAVDIAGTRLGKSVAFDLAETWKPNAKTEYGDHVLTHLHRSLEAAGVVANPVVAYDRWPDEEYRRALQEITLADDRYYVLRFGGYAIEDLSDAEYFRSETSAMLTDLRMTPQRCVAVADLGDLSETSLEDAIDLAELAVDLLTGLGFRQVVVAGCSLPPTIDKAVSQPNTSGLVLRREMIVWQALRKSGHSVTFGDYGVRNPRSPDDVPNPHTNAKIRYTTDLNFYIERGHSMKIGLKGEQYRGLARNVMKSRHFLGAGFSWGDSQIVECSSREDIRGFKTSTKWIAFDTNHHCCAVTSEIAEFQAQLEKLSVR